MLITAFCGWSSWQQPEKIHPTDSLVVQATQDDQHFRVWILNLERPCDVGMLVKLSKKNASQGPDARREAGAGTSGFNGKLSVDVQQKYRAKKNTGQVAHH